MSVRKPAEDSLSIRQKLTLFHGTAVSAERALSTPDGDINFEMMVTSGVKAVNIITAGVRPLLLKQHGVTSAAQLRRLGFDALHLVDEVMCDEASSAYGAPDVVQSFLVSPTDAVALAGSAAVTKLNIGVEQLLEACAGAPTEAISVLQQVTQASPLKGVAAKTLLDTGLRGPQLKQLGYTLVQIRELAGIGAAELHKLEYTL